jgi:hypothetical protein
MICSMAKKEIDKDKLILVILSTLVNLGFQVSRHPPLFLLNEIQLTVKLGIKDDTIGDHHEQRQAVLFIPAFCHRGRQQ